VEIALRVRPRSGHSRIVGGGGESLKVKLRAAPVDGEANDELLHLMSEVLGLPRRDLEIVSGERGRTKRLLVAGLSLEACAQRIGEYIG
jgi:uncharacterized protein (TIGR00251 family)